MEQDPRTNPVSQFVLDKCDDSSPGQNFSYADYTGRISLPIGTFGSTKQSCLGAFAPPDVDMFMKPMNNGDIALAVLNRGTQSRLSW